MAYLQLTLWVRTIYLVVRIGMVSTPDLDAYVNQSAAVDTGQVQVGFNISEMCRLTANNVDRVIISESGICFTLYRESNAE